jgi:hypothetical protein
MSTKNTKSDDTLPIAVRFPRALVDALKAKAEKASKATDYPVSMAAVIRRACEEFVRR